MSRRMTQVLALSALLSAITIAVPVREAHAGFYGCICDVYVYSKSRWMNRYWGLECNNHGGHGVCSTNVDSAHGSGCGAMTGTIALISGTPPYVDDSGSLGCPDDHYTCFRGPSACDSGGSWGNVCNCDTLHSQNYNTTGEWYFGDLNDPTEVLQAFGDDFFSYGQCGSGSVIQVQEAIQEHDPVCCDDPMGTLVATTPTANGDTTVEIAASTRNCNGGSQSGVSPNCGTFGATIKIRKICGTYYFN